MSFDVRGWSLLRPRREEGRAQRRADAPSYHGHFLGYTVAPKLYIVTPPLYGGHMNIDIEGIQRPQVDNCNTAVV